MDLILIGADLRDAPFAGSRGDALAVWTGRIAAVGNAAGVSARMRPGTRVIRLRGGTLLPGFVDAHLHFRALVRRRDSLDCAEVTSASGLLERVARAAGQGQGWLFAHGLEHRGAAFGDMPPRAAWDAAAGGRPLWLRHRSGHLSWLNGAALDALGWRDADPALGALERGRAGAPTGVVHDAESVIAQHLRKSRPPPAERDIADTARALLRLGTTAFADLTPTNQAGDLARWRADHEAGRVPQAVSLWVAPESLRGRPHPGVQDTVRLTGIKVILRLRDGNWHPGAEELAEMMGRAARGGWPVALHAVDGEALVHALEAWRRVRESPPYRVPALRLEHLNLVPPPLLRDLADTGAQVCAQPGLLWQQGELLRDTIPAEQWPWLFPVAGLRRAAGGFALGSDAPTAPEALMRHAAAACGRKDRAGYVWQGAEGDSDPRMSAEATLTAITEGAARLAGLADLTGVFRPGLRADAVYFQEDWPDLLHMIRRGDAPDPAATLCGGKWYDWR